MKPPTKPLARGWTMATVSRVGSVRVGRQRSPEHQRGDYPTPYLRAANITGEGFDLSDVLSMNFTPEERKTFSLQPGDIVLAEASGSVSQVGRAAIWQGEIPGCCYQNTVIRFRPHACLPEYALLVFREYAIGGTYARIARGVGILHLSASRFAGLPFPLAPLAEQKRIVAEATRRLRDLADAEASLRSALARTADQDKAILSAAVAGELVEPEATRAVREGRTFESAANLLSRHPRPPKEPTLFDNSADAATEESDPNVAPPGWAYASIEAVGEVRLGRQRSPAHRSGAHATPYLRAANITTGGFDLAEVFKMNFTVEERKVFALRRGDIVLAEASGSPSQVGRPGLWRGQISGCCYQNTVIRFRSRIALPEYSLLVFRHYGESGVFAATARGIGIQHLGAARLARLPFPLPPAVEQRDIVREANRRLTASKLQRDSIRASLNRFNGMHREVLTLAISGRLTGQNAAEESAEALLGRIGPVPRDRQAANDISPTQHPATRPPDSPEITEKRSLREVLRQAARPLRVTELFAIAGYDRDSTEDIEQFYLALRDALRSSIRQVGKDTENALLGATSAT